MKKYLKNMVPIGTIDKNPVYFDKKDLTLYRVRERNSFLETAGSSLIMILYVIIGKVNSQYYLTILGRYQFLMIGVLISFITAFDRCSDFLYNSLCCLLCDVLSREGSGKTSIRGKSNEEFCVKRAKECLFYLFISYHIPTNYNIFCEPLYHIWQSSVGSCFSFIYDYVFYVLL